MKEFWSGFFGYSSDPRPVEGFLSWQHIVFVTCVIGLAVALGIILGKKYRNTDEKQKTKVLIGATIAIWFFELLKWVIVTTRNHDIKAILGMLPLFLCSMQLIAIPIAAFSKNKVKTAACNFIFIFGTLGAVAGTYLASNYFGGHPVLSFDPIDSVITHCISGFTGIYVAVVGLVKFDKLTLSIDGIILLCFEGMALVANHFLEPTPYESNYMFLTKSAGTAFEICMTLVGGHQVLYTIFVGAIYFIYMAIFVSIYMLISHLMKRKRSILA